MKTILSIITVLFSLNTAALSLHPGTFQFVAFDMQTTGANGDFVGAPDYFHILIHKSNFQDPSLQNGRGAQPTFMVDFINDFFEFVVVGSYMDECGSTIIEARNNTRVPKASNTVVLFSDNSTRLCEDMRPLYEVYIQNVGIEGVTGELSGAALSSYRM